MRKFLIAIAYFFCAATYTLFALIMYQMLKAPEYDPVILSTINKAMMVSLGGIMACVPMLLVFKKNREKFVNSVAAVVDDFISKIYKPLKINIKRKEFWILQGYVFTRLLTFFNKYFCMVFVIPPLLFILDSSKEVFSFVINLIAIMIIVDVAKVVWSVLESNWRKCIKIILHVFILFSTSLSMERFYNSIKQVTGSKESFSSEHEITILTLVIGYVLLIRFTRNLIIKDIEKDIIIDRNTFGTPSYKLNKYRDLIIIDSINYRYQDLDKDQLFDSTCTFLGHLRYGLLQFEMTEQRKVLSSELVGIAVQSKGSENKELENDC